MFYTAITGWGGIRPQDDCIYNPQNVFSPIGFADGAFLGLRVTGNRPAWMVERRMNAAISNGSNPSP
jgi:hypothetical protein